MATRTETKSFFEITGRKLGLTSQLRLFGILIDHDGERFMNIFRSFILNSDITEDIIYYDFYTIENDDWWDNISSKIYGTPELWWIIALMNDINNPFEELEPGTSIKILKEKYLYSLFKDLERLSDY
jgi:nucleoid-associated protein YgaU